MNIGKVLTDVLYQLLEGTVSLFPPFHTHNPFTSHHQQVFLIRIEIARAPLSFQFSAIPGGVVCSSGIEQIEEVLEITVVIQLSGEWAQRAWHRVTYTTIAKTTNS